MFHIDNNCNCAYTTSNGTDVQVDIAALMKVMADIPEVPKIFSMKISLFRNNILPKNCIFMSEDVADALEEAMRRK